MQTVFAARERTLSELEARRRVGLFNPPCAGLVLSPFLGIRLSTSPMLLPFPFFGPGAAALSHVAGAALSVEDIGIKFLAQLFPFHLHIPTHGIE